jgi:hypothetical protein
MNVTPLTQEEDFLSNLKEGASIKFDEGSSNESAVSLEIE